MNSRRAISKRAAVNPPNTASPRLPAPTSHRTRSMAASSIQPCTSRTLPQPRGYTVWSGTPSPSCESVSETSPPQLSVVEFRKVFGRVYQKFYKDKKISEEDQNLISSQEVDLDEFVRLTACKQYERYISLLDGQIIFHEVPNAPHGQVIHCLVFSINSQINRNMFIGAVDNGVTPPASLLFCVAYM